MASAKATARIKHCMRYGSSAWKEYQLDKWYTERNATVFAMLANVHNMRGDVAPISGPRGLPDDVSEIGRRAGTQMGGDGHSHSWLLLSELQERERRDQDWPCFSEAFVALIRRCETLGPPEGVRLVFFFDN